MIPSVRILPTLVCSKRTVGVLEAAVAFRLSAAYRALPV